MRIWKEKVKRRSSGPETQAEEAEGAEEGSPGEAGSWEQDAGARGWAGAQEPGRAAQRRGDGAANPRTRRTPEGRHGAQEVAVAVARAPLWAACSHVTLCHWTQT